MTQNQVNAGKNAKAIGHLNEKIICDWLNLNHGVGHIVEGSCRTKREKKKPLLELSIDP